VAVGLGSRLGASNEDGGSGVMHVMQPTPRLGLLLREEDMRLSNGFALLKSEPNNVRKVNNAKTETATEAPANR